MGEQGWAALIGAAVGAIATLLATLYGPVLKARVDRRYERRARSEELIARYSEPLIRAAYDLQSRLYNILVKGYLEAYHKAEGDLADLSTAWLVGQYLGWAEILRREVQLLDMGDPARTHGFEQHVLDIADILATDSIEGRYLHITRPEQRAIGELMVVDRDVSGQRRADCMGFAEFSEKIEDDSFAKWFARLRKGIRTMADSSQPDATYRRAYVLQGGLVDLIQFLDKDRVRFSEKLLTRVSTRRR